MGESNLFFLLPFMKVKKKKKRWMFLPLLWASEPLPLLSITAASIRGKMPVQQQQIKGSWNNLPSIQYCKRTSELIKNCPYQSLSRCATVRWKHSTGWTGQFPQSLCFRLYFFVYSAIHHFKLSARIGKSVTKSHLWLKCIVWVQKYSLISLYFNTLHWNRHLQIWG